MSFLRKWLSARPFTCLDLQFSWQELKPLALSDTEEHAKKRGEISAPNKWKSWQSLWGKSCGRIAPGWVQMCKKWRHKWSMATNVCEGNKHKPSALKEINKSGTFPDLDIPLISEIMEKYPKMPRRLAMDKMDHPSVLLRLHQAKSSGRRSKWL